MREVKDRVTYCSVCSNITEADPCYFCTHPDRDHRVICVVEQPENVTAIEKTREFKGRTTPDGRAVAAARIGPDDLKIKPLLSRVGTGDRGSDSRDQSERRGRGNRDHSREVAEAARPARHAHRDGVPVGADLEYTDEITMQRAIQGRREL